jgi:hypothetical protein
MARSSDSPPSATQTLQNLRKELSKKSLKDVVDSLPALSEMVIGPHNYLESEHPFKIYVGTVGNQPAEAILDKRPKPSNEAPRLLFYVAAHPSPTYRPSQMLDKIHFIQPFKELMDRTNTTTERNEQAWNDNRRDMLKGLFYWYFLQETAGRGGVLRLPSAVKRNLLLAMKRLDEKATVRITTQVPRSPSVYAPEEPKQKRQKQQTGASEDLDGEIAATEQRLSELRQQQESNKKRKQEAAKAREEEDRRQAEQVKAQQEKENKKAEQTERRKQIALIERQLQQLKEQDAEERARPDWSKESDVAQQENQEHLPGETVTGKAVTGSKPRILRKRKRHVVVEDGSESDDEVRAPVSRDSRFDVPPPDTAPIPSTDQAREPTLQPERSDPDPDANIQLPLHQPSPAVTALKAAISTTPAPSSRSCSRALVRSSTPLVASMKNAIAKEEHLVTQFDDIEQEEDRLMIEWKRLVHKKKRADEEFMSNRAEMAAVALGLSGNVRAVVEAKVDKVD